MQPFSSRKFGMTFQDTPSEGLCRTARVPKESTMSGGHTGLPCVPQPFCFA
jgi:hypothetical protein